MQPLHTADVGGLRAIRLVILLAGPLVLAGCAAIFVMVPDGRTVAIVDGIVFAFAFVFVLAILPTRFEVWPDRLTLVFGFGKKWDLAFDTIKAVRSARWWEAYGYFGIRYATHPGKAVVIDRIRPGYFSNLNVVISPMDREAFLGAANSALEAFRSRAIPEPRL